MTCGPYAYSPEADELEDAQRDLERARLELALTQEQIAADHAREGGEHERGV